MEKSLPAVVGLTAAVTPRLWRQATAATLPFLGRRHKLWLRQLRLPREQTFARLIMVSAWERSRCDQSGVAWLVSRFGRGSLLLQATHPCRRQAALRVLLLLVATCKLDQLLVLRMLVSLPVLPLPPVVDSRGLCHVTLSDGRVVEVRRVSDGRRSWCGGERMTERGREANKSQISGEPSISKERLRE